MLSFQDFQNLADTVQLIIKVLLGIFTAAVLYEIIVHPEIINSFNEFGSSFTGI